MVFMCMDCIPNAVLGSVFAGIGLLLVVSAIAYQWGNPQLSTDWMTTAKNFLKYAVGFFFVGLAKWQMHEGMQKHGPKKR